MAIEPYRTTMFPSHIVSRVAQGKATLGLMRGGMLPGNTSMPSIFGGSPPGGGVSPAAVSAMSPQNTGWFGPGTPLVAMAPRQDVIGRQFDYDSGININISPRQSEELSFQQLRALAESLDLVKLCIETRKDQMENVQGGVQPKKATAQSVRSVPDARCAEVEAFLASPDKIHTHNQWRRMLVHEMLVTDATSIYPRKTLGGKPYALELIDGATIVPKLGLDGRRPAPPMVAYQQILKGVPAVDYAADELLYVPRNPRIERIYGFSPVQQLAVTMNIAIRREVAKLGYYTDGNIPDALMPVPADWTPDKINNFQKMWNALLSDVRERSNRMKFVPGGGGQVQFLRNDSLLFGQADEWIARVICYCFSLPSLPFVSQQNRATAETANEQALEEGLQPLMAWFKSIMDYVIQVLFGYTDLEWVWEDDDETSAEVSEIYLPLQGEGIVGGDEMRGKIGLPGIGLRPLIKGIGPLGAMFVDDFIRYAANDYQLPWQAAAMAGQMPGGDPGSGMPPDAPPQMTPPGDGSPSAMSQGAYDPLTGVPDDLLAAVGLGPQGPAGRSMHVTSDDQFQADPLSGSVAHPQVLNTLRTAEAANRQRMQKLAKRGVKAPSPSLAALAAMRKTFKPSGQGVRQ